MNRLTVRTSGAGGSLAGFFVIGILLTSMAAWCTHVIWIIKVLASDKGATAGQIVLGAVGAFMPPVGVVHGLMIWFGM